MYSVLDLACFIFIAVRKLMELFLLRTIAVEMQVRLPSFSHCHFNSNMYLLWRIKVSSYKKTIFLYKLINVMTKCWSQLSSYLWKDETFKREPEKYVFLLSFSIDTSTILINWFAVLQIIVIKDDANYKCLRTETE